MAAKPHSGKSPGKSLSLPPGKARRPTAWIYLLLVGATLAAYWPVLFNDFINYDDQEYLTQNPNVQAGLSWAGFRWAFASAGYAANWHPLTWLSHMLDCQLFHLHPGGHHLVSLLFHIANTTLVFLVLLRMTGAEWPSAFVAAFFALHPLHVESVAWAAERKDVLSAFFGLLSLWAYVRSVENGEGKPMRSEPTLANRTIAQSHPRRFYILSLTLYALALMSKPMLVTLPFLFLLLDYWPLRRINWGLKGLKALPVLLLEKIPFFIFSALSSLMTLYVQRRTIMPAKDFPLSMKIANAVMSCWRYLAKAIWPKDLAVFYPYNSDTSSLQVLAIGFLLILITGFALWFAAKRPYLAVGWFWFLGMLVPVLGLVQVGVQSMADRYTYLPLIGVFLMLVWAAGDWVGNLRPRRRLMAAIASILLLVCAVQTNSQVRYWHDTETIFTHALTVTRNNWVAHENLAVFASQKYQETQRSSIEGQLLASSGSESDAATSRKVRHDYLDDMLRHAQAALEIRPGLAPAHVSMAKALIERGQLDAARAHLEAAIRLEPSNAYAHQDLAEILSRQGQVKDAIVEYQNALKLKPDWEPVMNNLAWFLATNQDPAIRNGAEAVRLAERACALTVGTNLWYCHTLAAAYAENNEFTKSIATAEQARQLALASGRKELVQTAENRLALYRAGHCYREP